MSASLNPSRRTAAIAAALVGGLALAACSEDLDSGAACPALCPDEALATRDTVLQLVVLDTTLTGYPGIGREGNLLLAARGDTLDTRVVVRFDTIPATYTPTGGSATPYTQLESATLILPLDSARTLVNAPVTVEAYDVDAASGDTATAALLPMFTADRLLGRQAYATAAAVGDTARIAIDPGTVLRRIQEGRRLRLGLLLRSASSAQINLRSSDASASGARLRLRIPGDTTARDALLESRTPGEPVGLATALRDFLVTVRARTTPAAPQLATGGVYGRRALLQFSAPGAFLDSATLVRATLELTQQPNRLGADAGRAVTVYVQPVVAAQALSDTLATGALRDPARVASFLCVPTGADANGNVFCPPSAAVAARLDSIVRAPRDSGIVRLEVAALVRLWQQSATPASARSLVLRTVAPGAPLFDFQQGGELLFSSKEAAAALRPRLRVTYVKRTSYSLP